MNKIKIGNNYWSLMNLDVDKFRNGDKIQKAQSRAEWIDACKNQLPAWCYYEVNNNNIKEYGKLYNGYAIMDSRGLAPKGWHIPNIREWHEIFWLLGSRNLCNKLKNSEGWNSYNDIDSNGNNKSGLSILPGGFRFGNGLFSGEGRCAAFWSSTQNDEGENWFFLLSNRKNTLRKDFSPKGHGFSIRCIANDIVYNLIENLGLERDKWIHIKN